MVHLLCGEVVIFGSLGAVVLDLQLFCGNVVIFHCGVAGLNYGESARLWSVRGECVFRILLYKKLF